MIDALWLPALCCFQGWYGHPLPGPSCQPDLRHAKHGAAAGVPMDRGLHGSGFNMFQLGALRVSRRVPGISRLPCCCMLLERFPGGLSFCFDANLIVRHAADVSSLSWRSLRLCEDLRRPWAADLPGGLVRVLHAQRKAAMLLAAWGQRQGGRRRVWEGGAGHGCCC
jgi:hypothetical protein